MKAIFKDGKIEVPKDDLRLELSPLMHNPITASINKKKVFIPTKVDDNNLPKEAVIAYNDDEMYLSKIVFDDEFQCILASTCESYFTPTEYLKEQELYTFTADELIHQINLAYANGQGTFRKISIEEYIKSLNIK